MTVESKLRGTLLGLRYGAAIGGLRSGARRGARMLIGRKLTVTFHHRVDDPESLLVAEALAPLSARYGFAVRVRIVPEPAADVDPEPELAMAHARREAPRVAERLGLPPLPAIVHEPPAARARLVQAALLRMEDGPDVLGSVIESGRALFAGDGDAVASFVRRHGTVPGPEVMPRLEANYRALRAAGHFAGATVFADGEAFHRVDRLAHLEARLAKRGEALLLADLGGLDAGGPPPSSPLVVYASFQCPYSYLALARLTELARATGLSIEERPVRPLVMRGLRIPPVKRRYVLRDAAREAARRGIPFGPFAEPRDAGVQRALYVWHEAKCEGKGLAFFESALRGVWSEAADLESDADLSKIALRAGLDDGVLERAFRNREGLAEAEAHREARRELGLWGVPSFSLGGACTWGQDRFPLLFEP